MRQRIQTTQPEEAPQATAPAGAAEAAAPGREEPREPPAEGRLRGISKSIIIGVGGTGHKILLDVRKRLIEKYGGLERIPIVSFLQIDTDAASLDSNVNYDDRSNLDRSEIIYASVKDVGNLRGNLHNYPHLVSWLDERALTGDIYQGAGAIRARGRLAFFWNFDQIARAVEARYQRVTQESSITAAQGLGLAVGEGVTIYVVGSLLGGTGSGMFLDLAYTIRERVARGPLVETVGIFTIPPNLDAVPVDNKPNAYAALLELNHYSHDDTVFEAQYKANLPPIRNPEPPFQFCYLVDMSNPAIALNTVDDLCRMVGTSIFLDLTSEFQQQKKSNRDNFNQYLIQPDKLNCPQNYLSLGLAVVHFPADKVIEACTCRLAREILTSWSTPLDRSVNIPSYTDREVARLGLLPDEVNRQVTLVNAEGGETLRDAIATSWKQLNARYERNFPGYERASGMLTANEQTLSEHFSDTDPNPDLVQKRRENLGEWARQVQTNLRALIPAKQQAVAELVSRIVNNPEHRHGIAQQVLEAIGDRLRAFAKELHDQQQSAAEVNKPLVEERDRCLAQLNRIAGDRALRLIPNAARRALDEEKDRYIDLTRRIQFNNVQFLGNVASIRFYEELLTYLRSLSVDLGRYISLIGVVRTQLQNQENRAITRATDVTGEVLFDPGRRVVDAAGNESYEGGDIEQRYQTYAGSPTVRQGVSARVLQRLGIQENIYGLKDQDLARVQEALEAEGRAIFAPIASESVLEKFFSKYPVQSGRAAEVLKRVNDLSAPYIFLQANAPGYEHTFNKEQTVIGVMNGGRPQTEPEKRFYRLLHETMPNVYDQQIANSAEQHQVQIVRERAAFPLRLMQNLRNYRYAYDQARQAGAAANPMHIRKDVRDWLRIDPPSLEDQKAAWRTFVVAWAAGIVAEQVAATATVTGEQQVKTFSVTYTDNFGMPKTDVLGRLTPPPRRGLSAPDPATAPDPTLPPTDVREIVMRLCDDRTLHQQVRRAIERRLEELGNQAFGERLREHALRQHELRLSFYDPYYLVLAGDPNRGVVGYLEEIGWRPEPASAAPAAALPVCAQCGRQFPAGTLFCPQHGATLSAGGAPAGAMRCPQCGQIFAAGSQFCPQHGAGLVSVTAGAPVPVANGPQASVEDRLSKLRALLDGGLISESDYEARKAAILAEI